MVCTSMYMYVALVSIRFSREIRQMCFLYAQSLWNEYRIGFLSWGPSLTMTVRKKQILSHVILSGCKERRDGILCIIIGYNEKQYQEVSINDAPAPVQEAWYRLASDK